VTLFAWTCFAHSVFDVPDIPLNNFQAQFNESLMTMYSGYHPDAFWEVEELEHKIEKLKSEKDGQSKNEVLSIKFNEKKPDGTGETKEEGTTKSG